MTSMAESLTEEATENDQPEVSEWVQHYDDTYRRYYYVNNITGECQWFDPHAKDVGYEEGDADINTFDGPPDEESSNNGGHDRQASDLQYVISNQNMHDNGTALPEHTENEFEQYAYDSDGLGIDPTAEEKMDSTLFEGDVEGDEETGNAKAELELQRVLDREAEKQIAKSRTKDIPVGGTSQDYLNMARLYKLNRPYSDPNYFGLCVLCHTNFADMVFFPCEHRCVCSECILKENICSDSQLNYVTDGYCNCSLCATIIKLILPSEGGLEVEKYWEWVYEEPVPLPKKFMKTFRHSAGVISAVHIRDTTNSDSFENSFQKCNVS